MVTALPKASLCNIETATSTNAPPTNTANHKRQARQNGTASETAIIGTAALSIDPAVPVKCIGVVGRSDKIDQMPAKTSADTPTENRYIRVICRCVLRSQASAPS